MTKIDELHERVQYITACRDMWRIMARQMKRKKVDTSHPLHDTNVFNTNNYPEDFSDTVHSLKIYAYDRLKDKIDKDIYRSISYHYYCAACVECNDICGNCFLAPLWISGDIHGKILEAHHRAPCEKCVASPYRILRTKVINTFEDLAFVSNEALKIVDACNILLKEYKSKIRVLMKKEKRNENNR